MRRIMKKVLVSFFTLTLLAAAAYFLLARNRNGTAEFTTVPVERGDIVVRALAIGTIEPEEEVKVKSIIPGIVKKIYFEVGDTVKAGQTLMEILPNPTPIEFTSAQREMEIAEVELRNMERELARKRDLYRDNLISREELETAQKQYETARLRYIQARDRFQLLQKGTIELGSQRVESTVKAPVSGTILEIMVHEGDPVVPLTSYQPGTELCTIADMSRLVFKGTVDEIDVGRIEVGHRAELEIGALPENTVIGRVRRIAPKARKEGNATLFDIEIEITRNQGKPLRAGYSATASIIIDRRNHVLRVPERLVHFEKDGTAWVEVLEGNQPVRRTIRTGLSDGLYVEVREGLKEGDRVVERPPKEIT